MRGESRTRPPSLTFKGGSILPPGDQAWMPSRPRSSAGGRWRLAMNQLASRTCRSRCTSPGSPSASAARISSVAQPGTPGRLLERPLQRGRALPSGRGRAGVVQLVQGHVVEAGDEPILVARAAEDLEVAAGGDLEVDDLRPAGQPGAVGLVATRSQVVEDVDGAAVELSRGRPEEVAPPEAVRVVGVRADPRTIPPRRGRGARRRPRPSRTPTARRRTGDSGATRAWRTPLVKRTAPQPAACRSHGRGAYGVGAAGGDQARSRPSASRTTSASLLQAVAATHSTSTRTSGTTSAIPSIMSRRISPA